MDIYWTSTGHMAKVIACRSKAKARVIYEICVFSAYFLLERKENTIFVRELSVYYAEQKSVTCADT